VRLENYEIEAIKKCFKEIFKEGELYIFGSRIDDNKRGGDIDLYIIPKEKIIYSELFDKKIEFLGKLQEKIGEQKIDVIISKDKNRPIEKEALKGIRLI